MSILRPSKKEAAIFVVKLVLASLTTLMLLHFSFEIQELREIVAPQITYDEELLSHEELIQRRLSVIEQEIEIIKKHLNDK